MPRRSPLDLLQGVPLLSCLPDDELATLSTTLKQRTFRRGEIIFHRDDPGATLYIIRSGRVKISLPNEDGAEVTLVIFDPGEFFGEISLLDDKARSATATALEQTDVVILSRNHFLGVLERHPTLASQIMTVLAQRLRHTNEMVEDIVTRDISARLIRKILELAETHGQAGPTGIEVQMRLTQQDLASMVGSSRESVNKIMRVFLLKGWVTMEDRHLTVCKPQELRRRLPT